MSNVLRNHKDNVFCMLYRDRKNLLSLYNAVNGTDYRDESALTVVTLESAICLRMHNDAAFIIDSRLNLYEQQSTVNENMPLRSLYYVVEELKGIAPLSGLYGRSPAKIPAPKFITFYNGTGSQPEERKLRLSDLYEIHEEQPQLELMVRQINLSQGYNQDILQKCESLKGYMTFVDKVRKKRDNGAAIETAVTESVDECIREKVLADFFREHRSEVIDMGIFEFDEELYDRVRREESWAAGKAEGKVESILLILESKGEVDSRLRSRIASETEEEVLDRWIRAAIQADSAAEFTERAGIALM